MSTQPPLKPLHAEQTLSNTKLAFFQRWTTEALSASLALGQEHCLKARPDGAMLDGHHRIYVLQSRREDVDSLPREILRSADET